MNILFDVLEVNELNKATNTRKNVYLCQVGSTS
jgi:hypothetical protein